MKLSDIKGEKALEVIADLIDPISVMVQDKGFKAIIDTGTRLDMVKYLLKHHSKGILTVLALINEADPETYEPSLVELPRLVLDLINDPDVMGLFKSQSQNEQSANFGSATETIEAVEA